MACACTLIHSDARSMVGGKSLKIKGSFGPHGYEGVAHCLRGLRGLYPNHDRHKDGWLVLGYDFRTLSFVSMYLNIVKLPHGDKEVSRQLVQDVLWHETHGYYSNVIVHAIYPPLEDW